MSSAENHPTERLQAIFEQIEDAIFLKSGDGRYELINRAGARMLGSTSEQIIGRTDAELFGDADGSEMVAIDRDVLATGKPRTYERTRLVDGVKRTLFTTKIRYIEPETGARYVIGVSRDITQKLNLERQLLDVERSAGMGLLAGGVAHQVLDPLASLDGSLGRIVGELARHQAALRELRRAVDAELGSDRARALFANAGVYAGDAAAGDAAAGAAAGGDAAGGDDVAPLTALERLVGEASDSAGCIRSVVDGLRRLASPGDAELKSLDVHALLDNAISMARTELRSRVEVVRTYGSVPPAKGRRSQLQQAFLNLLVGIARSLPESGPQPCSVHITTLAEARSVRISIDDPTAATSAGARGAGPAASERALAVAMMRYVLAEHDGELDPPAVAEHDGRLVIRLPADPPPAVRSTPRIRTHSPARSGSQILIIDDEPLVRMLLKRMLGRRHQLREAESGLQAVEILEDGTVFDAILCDLMMPHMTGMDLYDWMVEHRPDLIPRIGFVTAGAFTERGRDFLRECNRPVLEKPFNYKGVFALLDQIAQGVQGVQTDGSTDDPE